VLIKDLQLGNKPIAEVPVTICRVKYIPTADHYFDVAWLIAVDGGLVSAGDKNRYSFEFAQQGFNTQGAENQN
jgi:hypothetical protein